MTARQRLQHLIPHLRRGVLIGNRMARQTATAAAIEDTLDGLKACIFLVDANGWIVHANASGHAMLAKGSPLRSVRGKLTAAAAEADTPLSRGIANADTRGPVMPLTSANGQRYLIHVLPLGSRKARFDTDPQALTAVIMHEAAMSVDEPARRIAHHYGLAPREKDVLRTIVANNSVAQVAQKLTIAESSVKTLLRRVFEKTGTCRQVELIKLCATFSNPFPG